MATPDSAAASDESSPSLEERFRAFVDATSDVVYQMSPDWRVMHQLLGKSFLPDTDTANSSWLEQYIPPTDQDQVQAAIDEVIRDKKSFELEHRVNQADGTIGWTFSRAIPLLNKQGTITGWFGTARDVTQQKQSQQAEHQREQQNAFLLRLTDTLRPLADPQAIQYQAARLLGEFLAVSRVGYAVAQDDEQLVAVTLHYTQGVAGIEGTYQYADYGAQLLGELQVGTTVVRPNIAQDPALSEAQKKAHAHLQLGATVNVPLLKGDRLEAIFFVHHQQARPWLAYELVLIEETAERIWAASKRARTEEALRRSETNYRTLFDAMDEGFATGHVIRDAAGQVIDIRYVEVNRALEQQTGLDRQSLIGRLLSDVLGKTDMDRFMPTYSQVANTGERATFEEFAPLIDRWFLVSVYARPGDELALFYRDITERKQAEQQQAFLLSFSDALRAEPNVDAVANRALQRLIEQLNLDRCYITAYQLAENRAELVYQRGNDSVPPLPNHFDLADFPQALKATVEGSLVIDDEWERQGLSPAEKHNSKRLGMRAMVAATLRKGEHHPLWSLVAISAQPRHWTPAEIRLVEDVAERTWVALERAKAEDTLQASERFVQGMIRSLPLVVYIFDLLEGRNRYLSPQVSQLFGYTPQQMQASTGELINTFFHPDDRPRLAAYFERIRAQPPTGPEPAEAFQIEYRINHPQRGWVWVGSRDTVYARDQAGIPTLLLGTAEDISGRKAAEQAVAESEKRLRLAIEATELATWEWDLATDQVYWNEQHFKLFGMVPQVNPLTTAAFLSHLHPDDAASIQAQLQQTIQQRVPYDAEFRIVREDGVVRWMYGHGRVTAEEDGQPSRVNGVMLDITERKATQEALQQSEQALAELRHLTLLSQTEALAQVGSWEYHRHSGQFSWSAGMYALTEIDPQRILVPEIYLELAIEADQAQARSLIHYLRTGLGHFEGQLRIQVRATVKTLRIKADVIGTGEATRVVGVDMDITQQLLSQQRIRETADSLQAVLDGSPASIGLLKAQRDEAGRVVDFRLAVGNEKLARFFGEPLPALLGQPAQRFNTLLWDGQTLARLQHIFTSEEGFYEEKQLAPPEQDTWVALSVSRQDDGVVLTVLDITALKQAQAQQQHWLSELEGSRHSVEALAQLKTALQHRSESLRAVSHDLKSNFGIINSSISLLELAESEAEREQFVSMALRNVQQATGLLGELLDLTRLESSEQTLRISSQNVSALFGELTQNLTPLADQQNLVLRSSGPAILEVETDELLLYRLLQNLAMNALKYTDQGQVIMNWGQEPGSGQWWFTVEDTGSGLATHLVERLNAPDPLLAGGDAINSARRIGSGEPTAKESWASLRGEGIGLRIVREITHLLGARLAVSSEAGQGTRFRVELPLRHSMR